ncbi:peptidase M61 [Aquimarina brevivitae]|uniref:Putative metalloprotease with PDZ domain n=1 Tax=Aquimarina brevivitae TaxID=323412 RepID=A0A4Q7P161_9FLAO|nr:peptidase M61 [Aquimarina brevivitae]RZS93110.1 putative metalloprotease with PDZ domain [Aquimarina brevivitae]
MKKLLLLYTITLVISCKTVESPLQVNKPPVIVNIDLLNVVDDKVKVEVEVSDILSDSINYFLPKIVPGTYQNNYYGKFIEDFEAFDEEGKPIISIRKNDNQWTISNAATLKKITYWVNDTFDSEDTHQVFSPTGTNIQAGKNFILNLYGFVGYFEGLKETKYRLFIKHPVQLEASTSLTEIMSEEPSAYASYDTDYFAFKRYADLVDAPIMYTIPDRVSFTVSGIEVIFSVYSPNSTHKAITLVPEMERMMTAQKNFLGAINTTKKYSVLLYLSTSKKDDAQGFGALEHNTSTLVVLPEALSKQKLEESLIDVVSHEFFHIVTPLTIHSEEIHNFDFNNPKMSKHLWLYEGTTEYFSLLFQIRQGIINKNTFYNRLQQKIELAQEFDNSFSFTEMSENILKPPYLQNFRNVYEKGALISMCLDIMIRDQSGGIYGVLDLVKDLSNEYGRDIPFKDDELFEKIELLSNTEVAEFLKKHVSQNIPINYNKYLNKVGLQLTEKNEASSYFIHNQDPFIQGAENSESIVFTEDASKNNFLRKSGIKAGDTLISINNKKYNVKNIYDLFGDSKQWKTGETISITIERKGSLKKLTPIVIKPTTKVEVIAPLPGATEQQKDLLKRWLND